MSVGIKAVSVYKPNNYIDNVDQARKLEASEEFIVNKIGMLRLARKSQEQKTSDLAMFATEKLFLENDLLRDDIDCLILITQNPDDKGLPHSSAILHNKLNLNSSCSVFDISLGCSGYVHGLSVLKSFMESNGFSNGVLVTADPYSKIINTDDRDTAMLFGDGATATWLSNDFPLWKIGPFDFGIDSSNYNALKVKDDNFLYMNGREVFNFAATSVPDSIYRVLLKANITIQDIDLVLLHQGSRYIVETLARRMKTESKTPFAAADIGNTVSSSIPMLLYSAIKDSDKFIVLSGFGVGLAWASCLIKKEIE
jgi:3-oxoacyl-[acyl-carrier-protein] synthase III